PLRRDGIFVEDGPDGALGGARLAVDAMVRVDVEHLPPLVEAVARADRDAVGVLAADARLGNDERHELLLVERPGDGGPAGVAGSLPLHMPTAARKWTRGREDFGKIPNMADTPSAELLARYHRGHDEAAAEELFRRYSGRLTALARSRLSQALASRVDAEDVVQSAYRSFFLLARDGEVLLRESGDRWRLRVRITLRKVCRSARRHRADCRSIEREHPPPDGMEAAALSREPTPAEAAALIDELRGVLAPLGPPQRRMVE